MNANQQPLRGWRKALYVARAVAIGAATFGASCWMLWTFGVGA